MNMRMGKKVLAIIFSLMLTNFCISPLFVKSIKADDAYEEASSIAAKMSLEEKVGQMLMPDFRNWGTGANGKNIGFTVMNDDVAGVIEKYHLGGVILFAENVVNTEQTVRLVDGLQKASKIPLLISIDQEGGIVRRLQSGTGMPGNMALGASRDTKQAYNVGKSIGEELNALGININFAPDMDVNLNAANPVIGVRSFGADPALTADMGVYYIMGLHDGKTAATVKHFPGHGDVDTDSHIGLPVVKHDRATLDKIDLVPFKAAMENDVDMIMTAHIVVPALDDTKVVSKKDGSLIGVPATLSSKILTDLVRKEMKYDGVITTDALNMLAIADNFGREEAVIKAINAGADIALMPAQVWGKNEIINLDKVFKSVIYAVKTGKIKEDRINESVKRILELKIKRGIYNIDGSADTRSLEEKIKNANEVVGSAAHKRIEMEAADKAVTLIKNENSILPFPLGNGKKIVLISETQDRIKSMTDTLNELAKENSIALNIKNFIFSKNSSTLTAEQKAAIDSCDYIITNSYNLKPTAPKGSAYDIDYLNSVIDYAAKKNKPLVDIAIRNPYDIAYLPKVPAYMAIYGFKGDDPANPPAAPNIPAAIRAIFGLFNPQGKLPVNIPDDLYNATRNIYDFGYGLSY